MARWITREHPRVDRVACPWLIEHFVDKEAEFLYVESDKVAGRAVNSATPDGSFSIDGLAAAEAIEKITAWLEARGLGRRAVIY